MSNKELPKAYNPADYEDAIYKKWEESGFFNPDNLPCEIPTKGRGAKRVSQGEKGEPYSIMMPPPNVTGVLHLGHALENSLMDIMARYQRMNGKKVLLLPGTDHAAVATQAKVEKILIEQGIKNPRQEFGREKLLEKIRKYAEESKSTILKQIKKMGTSCDWSRLAYTFDEARNSAVNTVFTKMYNDGLIYRGKRIVNWDAKLQTTISDDEIVWQEEKVPFYYLQYGPFVIATARPETKFGDKYVVMHPDDERYKKYKHGDKFECEWINGKVSATVIKDKIIDPEFGSGVMTITPWHDMVDFEISQRHNLSGEQIIDFNGKLLPIAGEFVGMKILEARPKIAEKLKAKGLLVKVEENYLHRVAKGDRSNSSVEPQIKEQWFVDVNKTIPSKNKSLKDLMREAVTVGHNNDPKQKVKITPERFAKTYLHWIDNLRDWCISRQIWWGHRIPVYYRKQGMTNFQFSISNEMQNANAKDEIYVGTGQPRGEGWVQDEDTLDTWFSSGLWTFSTLGWPEQAKNLKTFHPTSWMQMGYEILFFWMARMILMSTYTLDQIPFKDVYIHGMLRNEAGKKFSKSSGNNIDPLEVIAKFGTDALRLSVIAGIAPGNDSKFYKEKVEGARNMVNKLWNVARYIIINCHSGGSEERATDRISSGFYRSAGASLQNDSLTAADNWILNRLQTLIAEVLADFDNFRFSEAAERLRVFTWDDLADWYLEVSKFEKTYKKKELLQYILENILKLWHPFMPFVTEVLWQEIGKKELLMVEKWPKSDAIASLQHDKGEFEVIKDIVVAIRNARAENKVEPAKKVKAVIYAGKKKAQIESQRELIKSLRTGLSELEIETDGEKIDGAIYAAVGEIEIYLLGAVDSEKEKIRLEKELANLKKVIKAAEVRLTNKEFTDKAPAAIVKKEKDKLKGWQVELKNLKNS
ncbi:MAG: valine--tRNA ligase [bacterium]|nr:valine--tRNA ligase [bacterium]